LVNYTQLKYWFNKCAFFWFILQYMIQTEQYTVSVNT
jgi:hypothetical protein